MLLVNASTISPAILGLALHALIVEMVILYAGLSVVAYEWHQKNFCLVDLEKILDILMSDEL